MRDEIRLEDVRLSLVTLWKRKLVVVAVTFLFLAGGIVFTMTQTYQDDYVADVSVYSATTESYQQSLTGVSAMLDYVDIVKSNKVCERAVALMGDSEITVDMIQGMIIAKFSETSYILHIYSYSPDPELAIKVANYLAEAFVIEMRSISGNEAIQLLDAANEVQLSQSRTKQILKVYLLVMGIGFLLSSAWIFFKELFSGCLLSIDQCVYSGEDEILGVIPVIK